MWRPSGVFHVSYREEISFVQTGFQWVMLAIAVVITFTAPLFLPLSLLDFFTKLFITTTAVLGLTILTGNCGQLSLGHTAFMAVGAFVGAILLNAGLPIFIALICAGLSGGLVGLAFGLPTLRIKGLYLAFATLAGFYVIHFLLVHYFGGEKGYEIPPQSIAGFALNSDERIYTFAAVTCLIMTYFAKNIMRCKWGRAFIAVRDHDIAANTLGVNVFFYKLAAFFIGNFYAGVAGLLFALYMGWASVDHFSLSNCIWYIGMIIVGGMSSISGAFMGVFFISGIQEFGTSMAPKIAVLFPNLGRSMIGALPIIFGGAVLILFILFEPRGLHHQWETMKRSIRIFPFNH